MIDKDVLKILEIANPQIKAEALASLESSVDCVITNNISGKFWWRDYFLSNHSVIAGETIFRAREFWLKKIFEIEPSWVCVSSEFFELFLQNCIQSFEEKTHMGFEKKDASQLLLYLQQLLPLILQPEGNEAVRSWIEENLETQWIPWYGLCQYTWLSLEQQKIFPESLSSGILLSNINNLRGTENLVFDLEHDLDNCEIDLIKALSHDVEVTVIMPMGAQKDQFSRYRLFDSTPAIIEHEKKISGTEQWESLPSQLAEVFYAIDKIKNWRAQGISLEKIGVASFDIETYWPTLYPCFEDAGLVFSKAKKSPYSDWLILQKWILHLKKTWGESSYGSDLLIQRLGRTQDVQPLGKFIARQAFRSFRREGSEKSLTPVRGQGKKESKVQESFSKPETWDPLLVGSMR